MNKSRWAIAGACALISIFAIHFATSHIQAIRSIKGHTAPATQGPSALVRSLRPIYPYSIIAGGAYSPGELLFAHNRDAVVRTHYADFNVSRAKMVVLTDDRFQYVSYRLKNQIYWTKRRLRIPKGELLLTDGASYARARCGNRLSDTPKQSAASVNEPDPRLLSLPPITPDMLPKLALANPPILSGLSQVMPAPSLARTGALPAQPGFGPITPAVPIEPIWGGQPINPGTLIPGSPLVPPPGSPGSPGTPGTPGTPGLPTPPTVLPPATSSPVSPVPEPNTIYLFLASLIISMWGLLRITPADEKSSKQ